MKLVLFGNNTLGAWTRTGHIVDLNLAYASYLASKGDGRPYAHASALLPGKLHEFLEEGASAVKAAADALEFVQKESEKSASGPREERIMYDPSEVHLKAPLPSLGSKIACAGANFYDHASSAYTMMRGTKVTIEDIKKDVDQGKYPPWGFWKFPHNVSGPEAKILYPARSQRLDYEVEVAAIFGKKGKDISEKDAMDHVVGYTILNDFSLRDRQEQGQQGSFAFGKNFDGSVGLGPCIVLKDEIPDPHILGLELSVNGQPRQKGTMKDMIRGFPFWISYMTRDMTFYPGDMIASGTCAGTAMDTTPRDQEGRTSPERFLKPGDIVEATVDKIGSLRNHIVSKPQSS